MTNYQFTLVLSEPEESETDADELYSHFDDGTIITTGGVTRIEFDREGENLRDAVAAAIADVERSRFRVARVETPESHVVEEINAELMVAH